MLVTPTSLGHKAYEVHRQFHERLVGAVAGRLSSAGMDALADALSTLHRFFDSL